MDNLVLTTKNIGENGFWDLRNQLNDFVLNNFELLYEGAVRLGVFVPEDCYAPRRIQFRNTRLHNSTGLKYAHGHKYSADFAPSEGQLRQTVVDIQELINAAVEDIPAPFVLNIVEEG